MKRVVCWLFGAVLVALVSVWIAAQRRRYPLAPLPEDWYERQPYG